MMISAHVGLIHCVPREEGFSSLVLVSHRAGDGGSRKSDLSDEVCGGRPTGGSKNLNYR